MLEDLPARLLAALALAALLFGLGPARALTPVDLELVISVDISWSMDPEEQQLQRDGYVAAFRDPQIWSAIRSGPTGRIAVTYIEWAGQFSQHTLLDWMLIDGPEAASAFAAALAARPIQRARMTSVSGALIYSGRMLDTNQFRGNRSVIDVSGDGPNNSGVPVVPVRDELVAKGVVINGLPIMLKPSVPSGFFDIANLDEYYTQCVIGGPGSFAIPVKRREEFAAAIRRKLILEISDAMPEPEVHLVPTEAGAPSGPVDCLIGEKLWDQYMRGRFRE